MSGVTYMKFWALKRSKIYGLNYVQMQMPCKLTKKNFFFYLLLKIPAMIQSLTHTIPCKSSLGRLVYFWRLDLCEWSSFQPGTSFQKQSPCRIEEDCGVSPMWCYYVCVCMCIEYYVTPNGHKVLLLSIKKKITVMASIMGTYTNILFVTMYTSEFFRPNWSLLTKVDCISLDWVLLRLGVAEKAMLLQHWLWSSNINE